MATSNLFVSPDQGWVLAASGPIGYARISVGHHCASWFVALSPSLPASTVIGQSVVGKTFWINTNITDNVYVRAAQGQELDTGAGTGLTTAGTLGLRFDVVTGPTNATGGGGGGGGAATIADGADVAEGATTSTAYTDTTGSAAGTVIALLKGLYVKLSGTLSATLAAGSNIIGAVTQSGTWNINNITGTVSLPTGAATSALQTTGNTALTTLNTTLTNGTNQVVGNVASGGTDTGNPVKAGGVYNSTLPTFANGQRSDLQVDTNGNLRVYAQGNQATGLDGTNNSNLLTLGFRSIAGSVTGQNLLTAGMSFNGTSWDRNRKPNTFSRLSASATGGSPTLVKNSAGDVSSWWGQNGATITYLQLYNKATAPVIGTDTPILTYPIPASALFSGSIPNGGAYFPTGIGYAFTTDAAGTTAAAASAVTSFAILAA